MKWSDLTLKERKQIYDAVRAENPNASYFDIKSQFDLIPEYEDGVSSINLNEQWRKPVGGGMPRWEKANKDFKKLLSGLNKTIGTALTGASLATTGIWNAARLLNIGKGSNWRLAAAKNALIGSKAGLAADIGNFIEEPTVTNGVQVVLSKVGSKDLTTTSNKISKWSDPVDENMILDYFRSGRANGAVRNQYDLYIDKQRYIDRLNRLVPMEWLLPTIGLGGAEFLREKQNNKSN